ncbi:hypothetical protein ACET3Z_031796 [Daucus carota]
MIRSGVVPDDHTFPFVLKMCYDYRESWKGREVHGVVFKLGFDLDVYVGNTLLLFYGRCGGLRDVERVFDEMLERDVVSWNTVIGVFSGSGLYEKAVMGFREMNLRALCKGNSVTFVSVLPVCGLLGDFVLASQIHCDVVKANEEIPNSVTFTNVLPACARVGFLRAGKEIHARSVRTGSSTDLFVSNALIDMYAKCGCLSVAQNVFDNSIRDEVSYNTLIIGSSSLNRSLIRDKGKTKLMDDFAFSDNGVLSRGNRAPRRKEAPKIFSGDLIKTCSV